MQDLNGCMLLIWMVPKKGRPVNIDYIEEIITKTNLKVQIGGGIRNLNSIRKLISIGANRLILGTAAIKDFALVEEV